MKALLFFTCFMSFTMLAGQSIPLHSISSAGSDIENQGHQLSWNVGETCVATWNNQGSVLTEGLFQNFDLLLNDELVFAPMEIAAYPNPFYYTFNLSLSGNLYSEYKIRIIDSQGRCMHQQNVISGENKIYPGNLHSGNYFLSIYDDNSKLLSIQQLINIKK